MVYLKCKEAYLSLLISSFLLLLSIALTKSYLFIHFIFQKAKAIIAKVPILIPILYPHFILIKTSAHPAPATAESSDRVP